MIGEFFITGRIIFAPDGDFISVKKSPGANYLWQISPPGRVFPGNLSPAGGGIGERSYHGTPAICCLYLGNMYPFLSSNRRATNWQHVGWCKHGFSQLADVALAR